MSHPLHSAAAAASLEALCGENVRQGMCTGGVIELGTPEGACYRKAFGWMDREHRVPMPETALFDLASVTKAVGTTSGLALCMDRGLLDPDASFTTYLPDYRGTLPGPVTVRALARHLSGFSNQKPYDVEGSVTERILDFSPSRPAGEPYEYCCGNFILLGLVVERLLGGSLDALLRESLFHPLGMRDTRWAPIPDPDPRRLVRQGEAGTFAVASDPPARHAGRPVGNAGLFSTVDDLGAFSRMMLARGAWKGRQLLSRGVVDFLGTRPDRRSPVAFGWRVDAGFNPATLSGRTLSHTGWAGNSLWIDPATHRYAIVLTNRVADHDRAMRVRIDIAERALRAVLPEA